MAERMSPESIAEIFDDYISSLSELELAGIGNIDAVDCVGVSQEATAEILSIAAVETYLDSAVSQILEVEVKSLAGEAELKMEQEAQLFNSSAKPRHLL